jgi:hypothetical protein
LTVGLGYRLKRMDILGPKILGQQKAAFLTGTP